jgi:hypothetical protein
MPDSEAAELTSNVPARFDGVGLRGDDGLVDPRERQRRHLELVTGWAGRIREQLGPVLEAHGDRVHFRPGSKGIAMVGLLPDRPQRGKSGLTKLDRVAQDFEELFAKYCRDVPQGRVTGEKALQSWLISEAYLNGRKLVLINAASSQTSDPVELVFVTDEIPLPYRAARSSATSWPFAGMVVDVRRFSSS